MSQFQFTRPDQFPPIVKNLLIINVLVFVAQMLLDAQFNITEHFALYPLMPERLQQLLVENGVYKSHERFYPYQIATHMFTHGSILHIVFNMLALWMFGKVLETVWGPRRFLLFYFLCGIGAALLHLAIQYYRCQELLQAIDAGRQDVTGLIGAAAPAVGASGAIMGIFVGFAFLFPNTELYMMFIPIPIKAKWAVLGMAAYDIFGGIAGGDNIAHFAHLGGALTGFFLVLIWNKRNRRTFF